MTYTNPTMAPAWQQLIVEYNRIQTLKLQSLFETDPERAQRYSYYLDDMLFDLSKNRIDTGILNCLLELAEQMQVGTLIDAMFAGEHINHTEDRPVLHTALRAQHQSLKLEGKPVQETIDSELEKVSAFCHRLHNAELKGSHGDSINTVVNIGIGGSDLGPRMVNQALSNFSRPGIDCHFVANVDITDINKVLDQCNPRTTLFIVASKSFTTLETMMNANTARAWLMGNNCDDLSKHFVAITANVTGAVEFGIQIENIFAFWSWVGGRYSLWSAIGLPIAAYLGMDQFRELLAGAARVDEHFKTARADKNIPLLLGLLDVLYSNFAHAQTQAIVPYDHNLGLLPDYLSQLIMESNGKSVNRQGEAVNYHTAPVIWGSAGTNGQHAFFQLLHQGTHQIPIDFLVARNNQYNEADHQQALYANCIAQSEALMNGQLSIDGENHRNYPGNKPSTTIVYDQLTARTLGMILAIYEHRTFVQGAIYNINSFDQWGVELGKKLASSIMQELSTQEPINVHDASTTQLIKTYLDK